MKSRLVLFGPPAVERDGVEHALPFERRGQLVALLALRRAWVPRTEVAALLWPDQREALASANLRKTLFRLQTGPWQGLVEVQASALRCDTPCDVQDFEAALADGRGADALALRRGELLAGFDDDANEAWSAWLRFERDRLRAAWRDAALARLDGEVAPGEGLELATRLLDADPLDEAALRVQMRLLAASGRAAQARQAFRDFAARLADELGLAPGPELQALHDGLGHATAASGARPAAPLADEGFVGRAMELRRLSELLARDEVRLVTLLGPGGVGKTRLGRRVLRELAPAPHDGAFFVALDDVIRGSEVAARIARETGLALRGPASPLEQLTAALGGKQMVLLLDNFEQIAGDAALLGPLLAACPRVKLIVTSRMRLGLAGEQLFPLDGLPCPEPEDRDSVRTFDAARLFIAAAERARPDFAADAEAGAIVDICRQVEGLPLALELAAAWTRVLSCEAIAAELRAGTELLRATDAAHPPRHASIEVVFEQSWRHLVAAERDALVRLSVFRGGFSVEAARAVTGAPLPVLGALADKSLLRRDGTRLALQPLVQQLAAARLADGGAARAAHAAYFHRRLAQWRQASAAGDRAVLQAIDADFENCRLAWQHAIETGAGDALRQSAPALFEFADHRARFEDGLWLSEQLLGAPPPADVDAGLHALVQAQGAWMQSRLGRYEAAEAAALQALGTAQTQRDTDARFQALSVLGTCTWITGRLQEAKRHFTQALRLARGAGMAHESATVFENLSLVEKHLGDYEASFDHAREALAQHRRNGDSASTALCLSNLGSTALFMDDSDAASAYLHEALELSERHGFVSTRVYALANLTELSIKTGARAAAQAHAERAVEVAEATGMRSLAGWLKAQLARLAAHRGELDRARARLAEAAALAQDLGARSVQAAVLLALAELLEAQGHAAIARRVLAFAANEASLSAPDRDELRVEWARRAVPVTIEAGWPPALTLPALLQRVVAEAPQAHAPLIGLLQGRPA
jgi:predicted ATPase/DNA-binding SARP family transcriptional activator